MAKKEKKWWDITITKTAGKGGAWLLMSVLKDDAGVTEQIMCTAWTNATAAKRQAKVDSNRKTIKWVDSGQDDKGKPTNFTAKVEAKPTQTI